MDYNRIRAANDRLTGHKRITPLLSSPFLDEIAGKQVFVKPECLQHTGSFKYRGAFSAVSALPDDIRAKGVIAFSSGNHAQGVALAARQHGVSSVIIMPIDAPKTKIDNTRALGAEVVLYDRENEDRDEIGARISKERDLTLIKPFDEPEVIAGQGTCSKEFMEQTDGMDMVIAPIGGGGMVSGTCLTLSTLAPETQIIAAEPEQADDAYRSFKAGYIIADDAPQTIADGLLVPLKERTWHFVSDHVSDIFTATDAEIIDAMKLTWKHLRIVMEASSAVPLAVVLKNPNVFRGKRVGIIITGGNVDLDKLPWIAAA